MKVLFVSRKRPNFDIMPFIKSQADSLIRNGVEIDHFVVRESGILGYLRSIPAFRKKVKKQNFDLIHAHYSYSGWLAVLSFVGLPVVVSYMGTDVYGTVTEQGKKVFKSYFEIFLAKVLQLAVDKIIVKSQNLYDYIYLKKKTEIIPNGVNFDKFKPRDKVEIRRKLSLPNDKKLVMFLGHPTYPRKNFALLEEAFNLEKNRDWEIVNPYPTEPQNVPFYLNAGDVLVLTSYQEGSPNVIKEAMASNCPIVATDVGDVKEIIQNTQGCYLVDYDPEDVANKVRLALEFGKPTTGRQDIGHLEINKVAKKIISIYKSTLNR